MKRFTEGVRRSVAKLRPMKYLRELSVVIIGIVITFGANSLITKSNRTAAIKSAMAIIVNELKEAREMTADKIRLDEHEQRITSMIDPETGTRDIPADTLSKYIWLPVSMSKPDITDYGLQVLQSSGLIPYMRDNYLVAEILKCYASLGVFDQSTSEYAASKLEVLKQNLFHSSKKNRVEFESVYDQWDYYLYDLGLMNFILNANGTIQGSIRTGYKALDDIDSVIASIERSYDLSDYVVQRMPTRR